MSGAIHERCDSCDWSFGCFDGSSPCSKVASPVVPASPPNGKAVTDRDVIAAALDRVAHSVARHIIERSGWTPEDECYTVDLAQSVREIEAVVQAAHDAGIRLVVEHARARHGLDLEDCMGEDPDHGF